MLSSVMVSGTMVSGAMLSCAMGVGALVRGWYDEWVLPGAPGALRSLKMGRCTFKWSRML